jgi:hypothetical protein
MDFVYICRDGENEELRYSIRSVVKYFKDAVIWVVGGKPNWYSGNFVEVKDSGHKFQNIHDAYVAIAEEKKISNKFILMNDDFFILKNQNFYNYYSGFLKDKIISHSTQYGNTSYARALNGAVRELKIRGIKEPLNYDIHTPMVFEKPLLAQVLGLSLAPRSLYGNLFINDGINIQDVKIYKHTKEFDLNNNFISTEDNSFNLIKDQLSRMFKEKTKYEKY